MVVTACRAFPILCVYRHRNLSIIRVAAELPASYVKGAAVDQSLADQAIEVSSLIEFGMRPLSELVSREDERDEIVRHILTTDASAGHSTVSAFQSAI